MCPLAAAQRLLCGCCRRLSICFFNKRVPCSAGGALTHPARGLMITLAANIDLFRLFHNLYLRIFLRARITAHFKRTRNFPTRGTAENRRHRIRKSKIYRIQYLIIASGGTPPILAIRRVRGNISLRSRNACLHGHFREAVNWSRRAKAHKAAKPL